MAVADIVLGSAVMWVAPAGSTLPARDTVGYGDSWGGDWDAVGLTTAPVSMARNVEDFELEVEQELDPVLRVPVKNETMFETVLAEQTAANVAMAMNGTASSVSAGTTTVGYEEVKAGGALTYTNYAVGFEGLYKDSSNNEFPVRLFLYIATVALNGQLQFSKRAAAGVPVQFKSLADRSKPRGERTFLWYRVTAEATGE